jgi:acetolactate decarboxylase
MKLHFFCILILLAFLSRWSLAQPNSITQISTIDALLTGCYDGVASCSEMLEYGDFGLGTFDHLDGEMVILSNIVYQVKADGKVYMPDSSILSPFITIAEFSPEQVHNLTEPMNYSEIKHYIDNSVDSLNYFYAIKVNGHFSTIKVRSVTRQSKPFLPLSEVVAKQTVFNYTNINGSLIGFRCPDFVKGINVCGYHLHFISSDRKKGGHVLNFMLSKGKVEVDKYNKFYMILPEDDDCFNHLDLSEDRSEQLEKVER